MELPRPTTPEGRAALRAALDEPGSTLVALDFDGTLAPIVADPEQSRLLPGALDVLAALADRVALVAVVTGRPAQTVVRLGGLEALGGHRLVVRGAYGAETWDARTGEYDAPPPPAAIEQARGRLTGLVAGASPGTYLEDKGRALAVHTRRSEQPQAAFEALRPAVAALADELGLRFEPGRLVLEVRQPGIDKGAAVRRLVEEHGARCLVYAGDDLGDSPAFEAAAALRSDGVATLRVGVSSAEVSWPEGLVDVEVDGPEGVLALLSGIASS